VGDKAARVLVVHKIVRCTLRIQASFENTRLGLQSFEFLSNARSRLAFAAVGGERIAEPLQSGGDKLQWETET